jgi:glycosyltransferase involved in cell wall biosynthesis
MTRTDWHVLVDSTAPGSASAVVNVARHLQEAAADQGIPAYLVVGDDQADGRPDREGLLRPEPQGRLRALAGTATKSLLGRPPARPARTDLASRRSEPTHVYLHNQPWLAPEFRQHLPAAEIRLYAHNALLTRVPRPAVRRLVAQLDGIVCVSRYLADDLVLRCGVDPALLHVVHSGVDTAPFAEPTTVDTDVVFVGRMVPEKGVHVLLDALAILARQGMRVRARIAGASALHGPHIVGPYEQRLRTTARDLDVRFDGYLDPADVPRFLNSARIAVVPSVWPEPLGLVALEALASDAALVCTRSGGMPEVVGGGALLVEPGSAAELAEALRMLLRNEIRRGSVVTAGKAVAAERTWGRAYDRLRLVDDGAGQIA